MAQATVTLPPPDNDLQQMGAADVLVAVLSFNHADTISGLLREARHGAERLQPQARAAVVVLDAGSTDGTMEQARVVAGEREGITLISCPPALTERLTDAPREMPGRPGLLRAALDLTLQSGARGCVLLDADRPGDIGLVIESLAHPVLAAECDLVVACHPRQPYEGAISTGIAYPLTRTLYGRCVLQPMGNAMALSAALAAEMQGVALPGGATPRPELDLWLVTQAVVRGLRLGQAWLPAAPPELARDPSPDLSATLSLVLSALFRLMQEHAPAWQKVRLSKPAPDYGQLPAAQPSEPPWPAARLLDRFRMGQRDLREVWGLALPPATLVELSRLARLPTESFTFPDGLWARILYEFALGYRLGGMNRRLLLEAFTPIYLGWLASLVNEAGQAPATPDMVAERLCRAFETEKPYLISRWRWPDRFRP